MAAHLVRIVLLQIVTIVLSILITGFALKLRFGSGSHFPILATYTRDYGVWLMVLPLVWGVWGARENNNPKAEMGNTGTVFFLGFTLWVILGVFGFLSFMSACTHNSLLQVVPNGPVKSVPVTPSTEN